MGRSREIPDHVLRLLRSSIETVDRLDVLLHLRAMSEKSLSARSVATACGMTTHAVEKHLAILCGRGFLGVSIAADLLYRYQPISSAIPAVLDEIEELNVESRDDIVAALSNGSERDPVRAFANAFLVGKKDKKRGKDG